MHEKQSKSVHLQSQGLGLLQTMKQIRPEKKRKDNKKQIPITHAQKVMTKGMSNFKLGGREDKGNA